MRVSDLTGGHSMDLALRCATIALLVAGLGAGSAGAQTAPPAAAGQSSSPPQPATNQFSPGELIETGHHFFGGVSRGLASVVLCRSYLSC